MRIALYTADKWEHVCPTVRILGPATRLGFEVAQGTRWEDGHWHISPEEVLGADIVVIQRDFPRFRESYEQVMEIARNKGKPVIYDIDDWLLELPVSHPDAERYRAARTAILRAVLEADGVTCPTSPLAEQLKKLNENVAVLPNYLDEDLWREAIYKPNPVWEKELRPVVIGYMGGYGHIPDLEMVKPVLVRILRRYGDRVKMRFWGCPPPADLRGWKNVEWIEIGLVSYAEFARYFSKQNCDIFIAPLVDSLFNRSKSALKFLEYSILEIPGIYSHVAPYEQVVIHGENGFLARDLGEWENYLIQLIENPSLRWEIAKKARETVIADWLLADHAYEWKEVYERVAASRRAGEILPREMVANTICQLQAWDDQKTKAITDAQEVTSRLWSDIQMIEARLVEKEQLLEEILNSPGWKMVTALGYIRSRVAPPGSRRERFFFWGMSLLRKWAGWLKGAKRVEREQVTEDSPAMSGLFEKPSDAPLISLVVEEGNGIDAGSVQAWVRSQTYPVAEVVVWEKKAGKAHAAGSPDNSWAAPTVQSLVRGLKGTYVCVASLNLLREPETWLEMNLIALESEGLVFTINWQGNLADVERWLRLNRIPTIHGIPCVYVVRKEALAEDFSIDLSKMKSSGQAIKVGKIITYPSGEHIGGSPGPRIRLGNGYGLRVEGHDVLLVPSGDRDDSDSLHQFVRPIDRFLTPVSPEEDSRPSVLMVMPFLAVGGAERVALEVIYQLMRDIRFVILTVEKHAPSLGSMAGLFRQVTPYVFTAFDWLSPQMRFPFFKYLMERFSPRTLYIANGSDWIYDSLVLIRQRYPNLWIVNQVYDHRVGWINRYDAHLVACIDAHIGCNEKICQAYRRKGVPLEKVYLIEHAVDIDQFDPSRYSEAMCRSIREQMGLPPESKVITFMGRLHPQKRPMDFVELARRFVHRSDLTFLMVGDGPMAGIIDAEVHRIGLPNLVRRPFSHAADVLAISDVIVLPSEYEGMPMVVLEAQAMGKPVVVTDVGNTREILGVTQGGVLVPTIGDIGALMGGVEKMLESPPDPIQIREAVATHFDIRKIAVLYKRVLLGEK